MSYLPYLVGAAVSWCAATYDENLLVPVLNRDVFQDPTGKTGEAALALGFAHLKLKYFAPNVTPLGAVIAAPPPKKLELFCRDGLKYYARIAPANSARRWQKWKNNCRFCGRPDRPRRPQKFWVSNLIWRHGWPHNPASSCSGSNRSPPAACQLPNARPNKAWPNCSKLDREFNTYWPVRNKGTPKNIGRACNGASRDYRRGALHFPPGVARRAEIHQRGLIGVWFEAGIAGFAELKHDMSETKSIAEFRREYTLTGLRRADLDADPDRPIFQMVPTGGLDAKCPNPMP